MNSVKNKTFWKKIPRGLILLTWKKPVNKRKNESRKTKITQSNLYFIWWSRILLFALLTMKRFVPRQTENLGCPFCKGFRGFFIPVGSISLREHYFRSNIEKLLQYSQKRRSHILYRLWFLHNRWNKSQSVRL